MSLKTYTYDDLLDGLASTDARYYLQSEADEEIKRLVMDLCVEKTNVDTLEQAWKKSQRELWLARAELCRRFNEDDYIRKHCNSIYWEKYFFFDRACEEMSLKLARAEQKCRDMMEKFK